MRVLIDTHVLLWWLADDPQLRQVHRDVLVDGDTTVLVSSISIAEISIKSSLGKLQVPSGIEEAVIETGFNWLPFMHGHAAALQRLPWHHRDPFDRMLVAQAMVEDLPFATVDSRIKRYPVRII